MQLVLGKNMAIADLDNCNFLLVSQVIFCLSYGRREVGSVRGGVGGDQVGRR